MNTITYFIAGAEYLIDQKLTSPARLAIDGMSAGGNAVGGAITRRPALFAAAVIRVGMTNSLRLALSDPELHGVFCKGATKLALASWQTSKS